VRSFPAAVPAPADPGAGTPFGVYVHIPFCAHRCDYCAFATWDDRPQLAPDYVVACRAEIDRAVAGGMPAATSVFFGGGTPSLLPAEDLVSILEAIPRRVGAEVTVECNPEHADPERLATWRRGGVTRLSFGVQSMVPAVLACAFAFGGTAQFIAGLFEAGAGNSFGFIAFCGYGAFWWTFGLLVEFFPKGLAYAGWYLLLWGVFTTFMWIATWKKGKALMLVSPR